MPRTRSLAWAELKIVTFCRSSYKFNMQRCDSIEGKSRCYEKVELTMDAAHHRSRRASVSHRVPPATQLRSHLFQSGFRADLGGEAAR